MKLVDTTGRMNPEIKVRWVAWLRANVARQGTGHLRTTDDKYCCLGGLCELAVEDGVIERWSSGSWGDYMYGVRDSGSPNVSAAYLPAAVAEWAGLERGRRDLTVTYRGGRRTLASINDDCKTDFNQIADLIEEQL